MRADFAPLSVCKALYWILHIYYVISNLTIISTKFMFKTIKA